MTLDTNLVYYRSTPGTIAGFDSVSTGSNGLDLTTGGFSLDNLRAFLLNENEENFVSKEWMLQLEDIIYSHKANQNNPHNVTIDQVTSAFSADILGSLFPGTVPDVPPFFSFIAGLELPLGTIVPATYSQTNRLRMTPGGALIDPNAESAVVHTTYDPGVGGIALFSPTTNYSYYPWSSFAQAAVNVTIGSQYAVTNMPFMLRQIMETSVFNVFGVDISIPMTASNYYTTSFFYKKEMPGTILRFFKNNSPNDFTTVYMDSEIIAVTGDGPSVKITQNNGSTCRLSVGYQAEDSNPSTLLSIRHYREDMDIGPRNGFPGRVIFSMGHVFTTKNMLNQPTPIDISVGGSSTNLVFNFSDVTSVNQLDALTGSFIYDFSLGEAGRTLVGTSIATIDVLTFVRDATTVYLKVSGTTVAQMPLQEGINSFAFSYTRGKISFKCNDIPRVDVTGTYPRLNLTTFTFGQCEGYLVSSTLYAMGDNHQTLEFLTDAVV